MTEHCGAPSSLARPGRGRSSGTAATTSEGARGPTHGQARHVHKTVKQVSVLPAPCASPKAALSLATCAATAHGCAAYKGCCTGSGAPQQAAGMYEQALPCVRGMFMLAEL